MSHRRTLRVAAVAVALLAGLVLWWGAWAPASGPPAAAATQEDAARHLKGDEHGAVDRPPRPAMPVRTDGPEPEDDPDAVERAFEERTREHHDGELERCALEWQDLDGEPLVPRRMSFYLSEDEAPGVDAAGRQVTLSKIGMLLPVPAAEALRRQAVDGRTERELSTMDRLIVDFSGPECTAVYQTNEVYQVRCAWPTPEDAVDDIDLTHPVMLRSTPHTRGAGLEWLSVSTPEPEGTTEIAVPGAVWRVHWSLGICTGVERVE